MEGDALTFAEFLARNSRNFLIDEVFPEFGTARVRYKDCLSFDFASTRKEVYAHCGAMPQVVQRGVPLFEDMIRRDFTVNALALSVNVPGRVVDYCNGIADIEAGLIRVLHPASFYEDPSRILRAYKFAARFGFSFSPETQRLLNLFLKHGAQGYKGGGERIRYELSEFLAVEASNHKNRWLAHFIEHHGLRLINMELGHQSLAAVDCKRLLAAAPGIFLLQETIAEFQDTNTLFVMYLCMMFQDLPDDVTAQCIRRLGLTREETHAVECYRKLHRENRFLRLKEFSPPPEIYALFHDVPLASIGVALMDAGNDEPARFKMLLDAFKTYKRKWEHLAVELNGNDLIDLGVPKGRLVGDMLKKLLNAKLNGRVVDRMTEVHFVRQTLEEEASQSEEADHATES